MHGKSNAVTFCGHWKTLTIKCENIFWFGLAGGTATAAAAIQSFDDDSLTRRILQPVNFLPRQVLTFIFD